MKQNPLRTTVVGSYPFPGWLEFVSGHLDELGSDQIADGLDVISDGEQTRLDFNLSFYGFLTGIAMESRPNRRFGPPGHDQRGKHEVIGTLEAPRGLGAVDEYLRLKRLAPAGPALKV